VRLEVLPDQPERGDSPIPFTLSDFEGEFVPPLSPGQPVPEPEKIVWIGAHAYSAPADLETAKLIDRDPGTGWSGDAKKRPSVVFIADKPFAMKGGGELRFRLVYQGKHARQPLPRFRLSISTDEELLKGGMPLTPGPWHVLGRFPTADGDVAFRTEFGPEEGVDLGGTYGELRWTKRGDYGQDGANQYPEGIGATYVSHTVVSPSKRGMTFNINSDDAIQLWFNGALVLSRNVQRAFRRYDADTLTVDLEAGENRLLIKLSNYGTSGDHKFSFEILDEGGKDLLGDVAEALQAPAEKRTEAQKALLRARYRRDHWPEWSQLARERADLRGKEVALLSGVPTTLVFKESAQPRDAFVLHRGEYDKRGERVERGAPGVFPPLGPEFPKNRWGLARWLLDPGQPLLARVMVNRFWQQVFGVGLVKTSEDFGSQGEPPVHPELLDYLAVEFVQDGWDVKRFMRRLVTSATYRQSAKVTPELALEDPENRLLARGPRFRMDAETVRDQILFLSGLLVEEIGGPSVKPPQPEGLWEAVGYTASNTYRFQRDVEPRKVCRRSLYIFWKRTSAPPQMTTFDAPSRESCRARRERTNTPLQALVLMNEPQCFEAARHLAQKAIREGGSLPEGRAAWMILHCLARPPTAADVTDLVQVYGAQREIYAKDPESAREVVSFGDVPPDPAIDPVELACWTLVANVVLNLDEILNQ
jgi:hypothetical protein